MGSRGGRLAYPRQGLCGISVPGTKGWNRAGLGGANPLMVRVSTCRLRVPKRYLNGVGGTRTRAGKPGTRTPTMTCSRPPRLHRHTRGKPPRRQCLGEARTRLAAALLSDATPANSRGTPGVLPSAIAGSIRRRCSSKPRRTWTVDVRGEREGVGESV